MTVVYVILLSLLTVAAFLLTWFILPGQMIMAAVALLWGIFSQFQSISGQAVVTMIIIAIALEGLEFFLSGLSTKTAGGSNRSAVLAIIGGILGSIAGATVFFLIGAFLGLLTGSYLGAYLGEKMAGQTDHEAHRAALAALMGNMVSKALKSITVIVMGVWMIRQIFNAG